MGFIVIYIRSNWDYTVRVDTFVTTLKDIKKNHDIKLGFD